MSESKCRRCSECADYSHHWIPDPVPDDIGEYACKHCDARGEGCETCAGDGYIGDGQAYVSAGEIVGPSANTCPDCEGEGVVFVGRINEFMRLTEENRELRAAIDNIRDAVLHGRYQLAEMQVDSDIINAVLDIIDDHTPNEVEKGGE